MRVVRPMHSGSVLDMWLRLYLRKLPYFVALLPPAEVEWETGIHKRNIMSVVFVASQAVHLKNLLN